MDVFPPWRFRRTLVPPPSPRALDGRPKPKVEKKPPKNYWIWVSLGARRVPCCPNLPVPRHRVTQVGLFVWFFGVFKRYFVGILGGRQFCEKMGGEEKVFRVWLWEKKKERLTVIKENQLLEIGFWIID